MWVECFNDELDTGLLSFSRFLLASNVVFVLPPPKCAKGKQWVQDAKGETHVKGRIPSNGGRHEHKWKLELIPNG
jgi:hypothetical protein